MRAVACTRRQRVRTKFFISSNCWAVTTTCFPLMAFCLVVATSMPKIASRQVDWSLWRTISLLMFPCCMHLSLLKKSLSSIGEKDLLPAWRFGQQPFEVSLSMPWCQADKVTFFHEASTANSQSFGRWPARAVVGILSHCPGHMTLQ